MKKYTEGELIRIYQKIVPGGLLLPREQRTAVPSESGAKWLVFRKYSELVKVQVSPEEAYWNALRNAPVIDAIGSLAWVNGNLFESLALNPQTHQELTSRFVAPDLRSRISKRKLDGAALSVVFNRIGNLQTIRHLILFGGATPARTNLSEYELGTLALLANEFLQDETVVGTSVPTNLDALLIAMPNWDIYNPRNIAAAISRIFTILTEILTGPDASVQKLLSRLGLAPGQIEIDGMPLYDFFSIAFGLFAYGKSTDGPVQVVFNTRKVFATTGFPQDLLEKMLESRARTVEEFREQLGKGKALTREEFGKELSRKPFLTDSLNIFRQRPFVRLDAQHILILDVQFLAELLTLGIYWGIHDNLSSNKRETFKELWGRMIELYAVNLLGQFYPRASGILSADLSYKDGQVDALLDFGSAVIIMEIKSSLLTEQAKRGGDKKQFLADFRRKFIENEKGKPKATKQLASSCRAVAAGVFTSASPRCLDGGDVDLRHRHHRLEGTLCLSATSRKRIG
jgi:hypothetical protein